MSENDTPQGANPDLQKAAGEKARTKRPSHIAYAVREGAEGQAYFNRIGTAFAHRDSEGHDIVLDATPVNGRITLRTPKDRLDAKRNATDKSQDKGQTRDSQDHDR